MKAINDYLAIGDSDRTICKVIKENPTSSRVNNLEVTLTNKSESLTAQLTMCGSPGRGNDEAHELT